MGILEKQKPVKLVVSLIYKDDNSAEYAEKTLKRLYGPLEDMTKTFPFESTDYYYNEFGKPLRRKLLCFRRLLDKKNLADIKLKTNRIEDRARKEGNRTVNIDPGYVTEAKLVLLTTKDYTHRIYIGKRIFAEITLFFQDGTFNAWPWTYPDYASEDMIGYFNSVRQLYMDTRGAKA